jgi:transposase
VYVDATTGPLTPERQRIAQLERDLAEVRSQLQDTQGALSRLRQAYTRALEQLQLLRRRLFVAKAERVDTRAEQLAFDTMFAQVHTLEKALEAAEQNTASSDSDGGGARKDKPTRKPKGRRDLDESALPERRVEILDPELEGRAERIGFEESSRLGYERGGMRRIVVARAVYKDPDVTPATSAEPSDQASHIVRAPLPRELFRRALLAPAMVAYVLCAKYMMGVPFYRLEQKFALEGVSLDRGTMCRYAEDAGATLGAIVEAARKEAFETAFCLSTDATGVSIQPGPLAGRDRGPCRKGHFFVVLADRDHVFFEYQPKHTSAAVCEMFRGFSRYIQADAHAIYDALFRGTPPRGQAPDPQQGPPPTEVGCWSHCRRNFWEAAVCKHALGVEGLRRIDAIFAADALLADLSPAQRKALRQVHVRPLVDAFFAWVHQESARPRERGLVTTALGYARNQEQPLRRFLEDGRLKMDNNAAERALRSPIATGRKAWLFFGSDDHAQAAGNLFSLIASCKLHRLDPESYLADVIRVMPYWPRERYLELTPKYWARTRARLDATEMERPLGHVTVPSPLPPEEQRPPD